MPPSPNLLSYRRLALMLTWLALGSACALARAEAPALQLSADLGLGYDDNFNNARVASAAHGAASARAAAALERGWQPGPLDQFKLQASVAAVAHSRFQQLDSSRYQLLGRYQRRAGRGFYAPTIVASAAWAQKDSHSAGRDSREQRYGLAASAALTTRINGRASLDYSRQRARAEAFSVESQAAGLALDYAFAPRWLGFAGWQWQRGAFATTVAAGSVLPASAEAVVADSAFEAGGTAFRQLGRAQIFNAGLSYKLAAEWSLEASGRFAEVASAQSVHYQRWQTGAVLLWRY